MLIRSSTRFLNRKSTSHYIGIAISTVLLIALFNLVGCSNSQSNQPTGNSQAAKPSVVNIGYQGGTPGLNLLKARGTLEKRLQPQGIQVKWLEFKGGPPMMEAMAAKGADIGTVGNLPPIFAQAGGNLISYEAATGSNAGSQAIIVPKNSQIQALADLKGKKLAIQKGTALQYLALKALEKAGLTLNDIQPTYLTIPDSQTAFEGGNIDALPISDPYLASKEVAGDVRVLVRGADVAPQRLLYIATQDLVKQPDLLKAILEEQRKVEEWAKVNPSEVATLLAQQTKYKQDVWEYSLSKRPSYFGVYDISDEFVSEQQQVVDLFYKQKLIPKEIQIKDAVWKPT